MPSFNEIDTTTLQRLSDIGASAIDAWLLPHLKYLKERYRVAGDPRLVYLAAATFERDLVQIPSAQHSFQYSKLLALIAEMFLAEGSSANKLQFALEYIEKAIEVLERVDSFSEEIGKAHVSYALYHGVIRKALGKFDESIAGMREKKQLLFMRKGLSKPEVVMLTRQEVIMQQDVRSYRRLGEEAAEYARTKPVEYYGTVKRIFEFAMNRHLRDAKEIFPEFRRAFGAVHTKLPPLSHISFVKNVGQFLYLNGSSAQAATAFHAALRSAHALNLQGQKRQIQFLIDDSNNGTARGLITYRVA